MKTNLCAVFGNPIDHSLSPIIHQQFAQECGIALDYQKRLVGARGLPWHVRRLQQAGAVGANVTVPCKADAYRLADTLSADADRAQAVNVLRFDRDGIYGANTDGLGLLDDLRLLGVTLKGARILLIGAGGAAAGVLHPLLGAGIHRLHIANRTLANAYDLAARALPEMGVVVSASTLTDLPNSSAWDVVINATSAGLSGDTLAMLPERVWSQTQFVYDLMYGAAATAFIEQACAYGASHHSDGLGMLVAQAARAFELWFEYKPDTQPVLNALRQYLNE